MNLLSYVNIAFKIHFIIGGIIITSVKGHCTDIAIRHYVCPKEFF